MTMRWPWTSAARLDDILREKNTTIGRLEKQLADRERELHRLYDLIFKQQFGVQIHDTIMGESAVPVAQPEPELTAEQQAEKELLDEEAREKLRLAWVRDHRPSQLGSELARVKRKNVVRAAQAANPQAHPSVAVFAQARAAVEDKSATNGNHASI
jgi:hypothetical protein